MSVTVYGFSDDLVEVDGDVYEEFMSPNGKGYLAFSNGCVLKIVYDESGTWRITPVVPVGLSVVQAPENDESIYSDVATIEGDIAWVVFGEEYASK